MSDQKNWEAYDASERVRKGSRKWNRMLFGLGIIGGYVGYINLPEKPEENLRVFSVRHSQVKKDISTLEDSKRLNEEEENLFNLNNLERIIEKKREELTLLENSEGYKKYNQQLKDYENGSSYLLGGFFLEVIVLLSTISLIDHHYNEKARKKFNELKTK